MVHAVESQAPIRTSKVKQAFAAIYTALIKALSVKGNTESRKSSTTTATSAKPSSALAMERRSKRNAVDRHDSFEQALLQFPDIFVCATGERRWSVRGGHVGSGCPQAPLRA